jgi:hypothetical protein
LRGVRNLETNSLCGTFCSFNILFLEESLTGCAEKCLFPVEFPCLLYREEKSIIRSFSFNIDASFKKSNIEKKIFWPFLLAFCVVPAITSRVFLLSFIRFLYQNTKFNIFMHRMGSKRHFPIGSMPFHRAQITRKFQGPTPSHFPL